MWCSFVLFSAIYFGFYIVKLLLCFFYPRLHLRGKINKNDISGYDLFFRRYYPNRFSYYKTDLLYSEINNFKKLSRNHKMLRIPFVTGCRFIAVYEKMPYKTRTRTFLLFKTLHTCNTQIHYFTQNAILNSIEPLFLILITDTYYKIHLLSVSWNSNWKFSRYKILICIRKILLISNK